MRPIVPLKSWTDRTQDSLKAISMGSLLATSWHDKQVGISYFLREIITNHKIK